MYTNLIARMLLASELIANEPTGNLSSHVIVPLSSTALLQPEISTRIPPGFVILSKAYDIFESEGHLDAARHELDNSVKVISDVLSQRRSQSVPFLISLVNVDSNAAILSVTDYDFPYLGLTPDVVIELSEISSPAFALEVYKVWCLTYGKQVLDISPTVVIELFDPLIARFYLGHESGGFERLVVHISDKLVGHEGWSSVGGVAEQLHEAVRSIYGKWQNQDRTETERADRTRRVLLAQAIVLGNAKNSGTGMAISRNPLNGEDGICGEFVPEAHLEEAESGAHPHTDLLTMSKELPQVFRQLLEAIRFIETRMQDVVQIQFVVEDGKLYIMGVTSAHIADKARVKISVDMVHTGILTKSQAVRQISPSLVSRLLNPTLIYDKTTQVVTSGLPAGPGFVLGKIVFDAHEAQLLSARGESVILVRRRIIPSDFPGIAAAKGLLLTTGGTTSHGAVIARGLGKVCVVGVTDSVIDEQKETLQIGKHHFSKGDALILDGISGKIMVGSATVSESQLTDDLIELLNWADKLRTIDVLANIGTPGEALTASEAGADGIGLCRTEHLCLDPEHLTLLQRIILAKSDRMREVTLDKFSSLLREDFRTIFSHMLAGPTTIRLIDAPLHEFLPNDNTQVEMLAHDLGLTVTQLTRQIDAYREVNPVLGIRGPRLDLIRPELLSAQVRAAFLAYDDMNRQCSSIQLYIMIPFVMGASEVQYYAQRIESEARFVGELCNSTISYKIGAMIELPRAALTADQIARYVDFISFGTNDLTQMSLGLSRDDSAGFIHSYAQRGWLTQDPFRIIDHFGVGKLMQEAVRLARATRPELIIGICGEHGGIPDNFSFFQELSLDYVSCSPRQVPIARLASAQVSYTS